MVGLVVAHERAAAAAALSPRSPVFNIPPLIYRPPTTSDDGVQVLRLTHAREKHLRLAAVRFVRAIVGTRDDFYNRHLVR